MKRIIAWFVGNPVAANLLMAILVVGGLLAAVSLHLEEFPRVDRDIVTITVEYLGAAPAEGVPSLRWDDGFLAADADRGPPTGGFFETFPADSAPQPNPARALGQSAAAANKALNCWPFGRSSAATSSSATQNGASSRPLASASGTLL